MEDLISVEVFCDKRLKRKELFKGSHATENAFEFIEKQVRCGYYCVMSRLQNGRAWCVADFKPKESI